jgi:hypothetical protein
MKKAEVKLGGRYTAKVSDKLTTVRIDAENPRGGWDATNEATGKKVRIKSAQRLRGPARAATGGKGDAPAAEAGPDATRANVGRKGASRAAAKKAKKAKTPRERRPSLLDLAAEVLAKAKGPMDCKSIVEKVLATGRWTTKGKTPAATLYSAILRECQKKGKDARFKKVGRGKFAATGAGKKEG